MAPGLRLIELVQARSPEEAASALQRWGLLIDTAQCTDCEVCVTACHEENGVTGHGRPATDAQQAQNLTIQLYNEPDKDKASALLPQTDALSAVAKAVVLNDHNKDVEKRKLKQERVRSGVPVRIRLEDPDCPVPPLPTFAQNSS